MRWSDVQDESDEALDRLNKLIGESYNAALKKSITMLKGFFTEYSKAAAERDRLIAAGQDTEKVEQYIRGKLLRIIREQDVIDKLVAAFHAAGVEIAPEIRSAMGEIYKINADGVFASLNSHDLLGRDGQKISFSMVREDQAALLAGQAEGYFDKIAYDSLGNKEELRRMFQSEMMQAVLRGEGQDKVVRRLQRCGVHEAYRARRIAQTEHTRVQSAARENSIAQAVAAGVNMAQRWRCKMTNSRDSHKELDGQMVNYGEKFVTHQLTKHGLLTHYLRFPGDPEAPAGEVINCHCVLVPVVLRPDETVQDGRIVKR